MPSQKRSLSELSSSDIDHKAECANTSHEQHTYRCSQSRRQTKRNRQSGQGQNDIHTSHSMQSTATNADLQSVKELTSRIERVQVREPTTKQAPASSVTDDSSRSIRDLRRQLQTSDEIIKERHDVIKRYSRAQNQKDALLEGQNAYIDDLKKELRNLRFFHHRENERWQHELQQLGTTIGSQDTTHLHQIVLQQQRDILSLRTENSNLS